MSEKLKELKEGIEGEKALLEKFLEKQDDEVAAAHTEGMIDGYNNVLIWIENL